MHTLKKIIYILTCSCIPYGTHTEEYEYPIFLENGAKAGTIILREGDITDAKGIDALILPIDTNGNTNTGTAKSISAKANNKNLFRYMPPKAGYSAKTDIPATLESFIDTVQQTQTLKPGSVFLAPSLGLLSKTDAPYLIAIVTNNQSDKILIWYKNCFALATLVNNISTRPKAGGGHGTRYPYNPNFYGAANLHNNVTNLFFDYNIQYDNEKHGNSIEIALEKMTDSNIKKIASDRLALPINTIAFPLIGTGASGISAEATANSVLETIVSIAKEYAQELEKHQLYRKAPSESSQYNKPYTVILYFYNNSKDFGFYKRILEKKHAEDKLAQLNHHMNIIKIAAS